MLGDLAADPRLAALGELDIMGTPPEERFDRITRMARDLFGVPMAEIHFLDETTLFTKSPQLPGWPLQYPRAGTFCDATLREQRMIVIPDLETDGEFAAHENVAGAPHVRFYAGRPLMVESDLAVGTLCLLDFVPRELTADQEALLDELGDWVERELRDRLERDRAADVQMRLAPDDESHPAGYEFSGLSIPLRGLAGDFYSWRGGDVVDLTLVDVMGKGTAAAIVGAGVRSAFHARTGASASEVVTAVNEQLLDDFAATGTFATLFHARLETATGRLSFVDAGHGLSVLLRPDGSFQRLASLGLPLGIAAEGGWVDQTVELASGDSLVSFTDGLLDLYDGTLDSLTEATELARSSGSTEEFFAAIRALADSGKALDDITVLVVTRT
jgi:sigma-B regulation protein RsbU (phosphoserine phosphatase)